MLDGEVAELQADTGGLSAQQLKIYALRADECEIFATTKEDLEHETVLREMRNPSVRSSSCSGQVVGREFELTSSSCVLLSLKIVLCCGLRRLV